MVSLLLFKVSVHYLPPLGSKCLSSPFLLTFLWNPNPYKEGFRNMSHKVKAVCGNAMFTGWELITPSQGNSATTATQWLMLFHLDQLRVHWFTNVKENIIVFCLLQLLIVTEILGTPSYSSDDLGTALKMDPNMLIKISLLRRPKMGKE